MTDAESAIVPPLVSVEWLEARRHRDDLVVLDASWYLPAAGRDPESEYHHAHIPGALRFDLDVVSDHRSSLPHMLPLPGEFAAEIGRLGIGPADMVVCYDGSGVNLSAARVWWMFRTFGHTRVAVLDGGFGAWVKAALPVQQGLSQRASAAYSEPPFVRSLLCDREAVASISLAEGSTVQIVDARPAPRFYGDQDEPRPGLRRGNIPGSHNLPFTQLTNPATGLFRSAKELRELFAAQGVDVARPMVATCGSGVSACVLALGIEVIRAAGEGPVGPPVAIYDGSWAEWGRV